MDIDHELDMFCDWVAAQHRARNQTYSGHDYQYHLIMVANVVRRFDFLIEENFRIPTIAAAYAHDFIEDACGTYNDLYHRIKFHTTLDPYAEYIAEISRACCNLTRGRNREERMPDWIYQDIRETKNADFVKISDRIANVEHSCRTGSSMFNKYKQEHNKFVDKITNRHNELKPMLDYLEQFILTGI